jgi:predicted TPR repeat methyltransferase
MGLQPYEELEQWWQRPDPWGYESNPQDQLRRARLLSVLPRRDYDQVLEIGCGDGFVTRRLPGREIVGLDLSHNAVAQAEQRNAAPHIRYCEGSIFALPSFEWRERFDLIVVSGVLYPQYVGESLLLVQTIIDDSLRPGGHLVCQHIREWYDFRFPYITISRDYYSYREYNHILEVYLK